MPFTDNGASTRAQTATVLVRMITATEPEVLQSKSGSQEYDSENVSGLCCITKAALCRDILFLPLMYSSLCNCWCKNDERGHESLILKDWHPNLTFSYSLLLRWIHCSCAGNISRSIWSDVCQGKLKYKCETAAVKIQLKTWSKNTCCFLIVHPQQISEHISWKKYSSKSTNTTMHEYK